MPAQTPLRGLELASGRPALAPVPVPSGAGIDREDLSLAARRFRDLLVGLDLIAALALPEGSTNSSAPGRQSGLPTLRLRTSTVWDLDPQALSLIWLTE
jgi:hypothetical protein